MISARTGFSWLVLLLLLVLPLGCRHRVSVAEAAADPLACAVFVAERTGESSPELLSRIALAYAEDKNCARALQVIDRIKTTSWLRFDGIQASSKVLALGDVAVACARTGDAHHSEIAFSDAAHLAERITHRQDVLDVFRHLAMQYAELGKQAEALAMLSKKNNRRSLDAESRATELLLVTSKLIEVAPAQQQELVATALQLASTVETPRSRANILVDAASALFALARPEQAEAVMTQATAAFAAIKEDGERDWEINRAVAMYARARQYERAKETIDLLTLEYQKSLAWCAIATALLEQDEINAALNLVPRMTGFSDRAEVLKLTVTRVLKSEQVNEAIAVSERVQSFLNRAAVRTEIALHFLRKNDQSNAQKYVALALNDVDSETGGGKEIGRAQIAVVLAKLGERERARQVVQQIGQSESGFFLLDASELAASLGDYEFALESTRAIVNGADFGHAGTVKSSFYRAEAMVAILLQYAKARPAMRGRTSDIQQKVIKIG